MRITDELRHYILVHVGSGISLACEKAIANIAKRIDERVENIRFNEYQKGYQDGIRDGRSCEWDYWESTHIELPKDADGVPIHIGDVLTDDAEFKSEGNVECLMLDKDGWYVWFSKGWTPVRIHKWHHYHNPTVENVLRDFAYCCEEGATEQSIDEVIAEYAKKLRLMNGEES